MSAVTDFPLIWRWTSSSHAMFSASELAGLHPCSAAEAARIHDDSRSLLVPTGLNRQQLGRVLVQSADISVADGCAWLREQATDLGELVALSWGRDMALRTSWEFFTAHWDDFCYPFDDVLILPDSSRWILFYHHEETFHFGSRNA